MTPAQARNDPTPEAKTVLVTGATGNQGGAVARALLARGHHVRAMTRRPTSEEAKPLDEAGAFVVRGDFNDPNTIQEAAEGVDAAYVVTTPYEDGPEAETEQGRRVVRVLAEAGVGHVVLASVASADRDTGIPIFDSKVPVEKEAANIGADHTIVAPVFFRENLLGDDMLEGLQQGKLVMALPEDTALQTIGIDEIGRFVCDVIEDPDTYKGRRVELASDETTGPEMAEAISEATGTQIEYDRLSLDTLREANQVFATMFEWFEKTGYDVDVSKLQEDHPDAGWMTFREWADAQPWGDLLEETVTA